MKFNIPRDMQFTTKSQPGDVVTSAEALAAIARMPKAEAHASLDEIESSIELERLKAVWNASKNMPERAIIKALGPEFGPRIEGLIETLRTAKGAAKRAAIKEARGLAHRLARQQERGKQETIKLAERIERYDRIAAEINRFLHGPMKLQRLEGSHWRQLLAADTESGVFTSVHKGREEGAFPPGIVEASYSQASVFVVEHDWAAAFASAPDVFNGPVVLPDTACAFEFLVDGHVVIAIIGQIDDNPTILPFIRAKEGWLTLGSMMSRHGQIGFIKGEDVNPGDVLIHVGGDTLRGNFVPLREDHDTHRLYTLIDRQVRAVGVALDAKVVVKTAVRMPYKSNQPPKGPGKPKPFYSYHTVSLAHRAARLEPVERDETLHVPGPKRRLHFRRGHWRHFDGWKTWVNWCLVGDPDLGFVDKHYKL